ncbi:MAG: hypothetical protein WAW88_00725 [Nocardioides sp.]
MTLTAPRADAAQRERSYPAAPGAPFYERLARSPLGFTIALVLITTAGLGLDHFATLNQQRLLGVCDTVLFIFVLRYFTPEERATAIVVVLVATWSEFIGSIVWGLYIYRLDNLPWFVPAGHGLVFLTGLRLSQTRWAREHARRFMLLTFAFAAGWALLGLTGWLGRIDAAGAFGVLVVSLAMLFGRAPTVYAGVFWFVAYLEIYGTAIGTWYWVPVVPGLGVPNGNPPSGAASGYVAFDLTALLVAPWLLRKLPRAFGLPRNT